MRIPPYWAKVSHYGKDGTGEGRRILASGWSFESFADATANATARAKRVLERLGSTAKPGAYEYLDTPLKEEIVEYLGPPEAPIAAITRNRYGALVLNSAKVGFVDIDEPPLRTGGILDSILTAFSSARRERKEQAARDAVLERVRTWARRSKDNSLRLYRTAAGWRLLLTGRLFDPTARETADLLRELGSDPLYMKLTDKQECFRARLTPKPWRCGCSDPPNRFPWDDARAEETYRSWQRNYEDSIRNLGTCSLVEEIGSPCGDGQVAAVLALHDEYACREDDAKLA